jgi:hypothetical protein
MDAGSRNSFGIPETITRRFDSRSTREDLSIRFRRSRSSILAESADRKMSALAPWRSCNASWLDAAKWRTTEALEVLRVFVNSSNAFLRLAAAKMVISERAGRGKLARAARRSIPAGNDRFMKNHRLGGVHRSKNNSNGMVQAKLASSLGAMSAAKGNGKG